MDNPDNVLPPDSTFTPPPVPPTWYEQLSQAAQRMPAGLFAIISLVLIFILFQLVGGVLTLVFFGTDLTKGNVTAFRLATMFGQFLFILLPTLVLARLRFPRVRNFFRFGGINPLQIFLVIVSVIALQP